MASAKQSTPEPLTPLTFQILLAVSDQPRHGYGIIKEIVEATSARLNPATGTVYLALRRMTDEGLLEHASRPAGDDERRRYYAPTRAGRDAVAAELRQLFDVLQVARRKRLRVDGGGGLDSG